MYVIYKNINHYLKFIIIYNKTYVWKSPYSINYYYYHCRVICLGDILLLYFCTAQLISYLAVNSIKFNMFLYVYIYIYKLRFN